MTIRVITTTISRDWTCDLGSAATCMVLGIHNSTQSAVLLSVIFSPRYLDIVEHCR